MKKFLILLAGGIFLSAWLTSCTEQSPIEPQPEVAPSVQDATSPGSTVIRGWGGSPVSSVPFVKYHPVPYKMRGLANLELAINGGFESGDFTGWTTYADGDGFNGAPENVWSVGSSASLIGPPFEFDGEGNIIGGTELHGESVAYSGIVGASAINNGATYAALYQDVTLPSVGLIELKYAIRWKNFFGEWLTPDVGLGALYNQGMDVVVTLRDPVTDAILATLFQASTESAPLFSGGGDATTAPYEVRTTDISAYAGQAVRLKFENYAALFFQVVDIDAVEIVLLTAGPLDVTIDIKPGSDTNPINLKSKGVIPVAILSTADFDATTVDGATVLFAGASPSHGSGHLEDVDGDGDLDWLGHFKTQETNIQEGDTSAGLTGTTTSGQAFQGSDSIQIVKGSSKGK